MAATSTEDFFSVMKSELREELKVEIKPLIEEMLVSAYRHKTLTIAEAAEYINVSEDTLRNMVRDGQIPHYRARGRILFRMSSLDKWIDRQEQSNYTEEVI